MTKDMASRVQNAQGTPQENQAVQDARMREAVKRQRQKDIENNYDGDTPLGWYEDPGRDEDDEDCLFKNRWLRRGGCGMIISSSGVGKSSFTMQAAIHWAMGVEMLGIRPLKPLKVGIVQSEDDEYDVANFRNRIEIGIHTELKFEYSKIRSDEVERVITLNWDGSVGSKFVEFVKRKQLFHHFDLIIVNPLHAFFGGDLKNADEVSRFLRNGIDRVIKDEATKCAMLFVHHTGKPSKEKLAEGDFFAGYLGSGSAELINYPRIALTLTPYNNGKVPGVFNLIGSKHGDKLGWKTADGKPTNKRTVCYANRLARHKADGCIYWVAPTTEELEELIAGTKSVISRPGRKADGDPKADAAKLIEKLKSGDMTRMELQKYAESKEVIGGNRGYRAYQEVIHNLKNYGLVEKIRSGETTKIGFPDLFTGNDAASDTK